MTNSSLRSIALLLAVLLCAHATAGAATKPPHGARVVARGRGSAPDSVAVQRLESRYAPLVWRHRPDLAEQWGMAPYSVRFQGLDEATLDAHHRELRHLLAAADTLPAGARADSLRAHLHRDLADAAPGGALRRDALVWLDIVAAAARAPFALGSSRGCDRTRRATLQLNAIPEALRAAIVLLRGSSHPEPARLEARLGGVERLLRDELPKRTEPCKESRRVAEFVEADSLAAASLAQFRDRLSNSR
ncbi:MAG: hypothetical protein ABL977_16005 [Candidatus Eisenbacteria bacterium]